MSRRKAEMVLELVDRATRPMRRFMALQRRSGRAVELANRVAERSARAASRATDLYKGAVNGLKRAQDALRATLRKTNEAISRNVARARAGAAQMGGGFQRVGQAAVVSAGLMTAYSVAVGGVGTALLGPARQFEQFQSVLTTTEGSAAAAQKAMGWVEDFAVNTPYELDQVMESFVQLRAYGLDPTNGMLKTLGDTSAAMNKPLMQSVEAMADAVTGENERLKEFGIKASKVGKYFEYSYTGKDGTSKIVKALADDKNAIQAAILGIFSERYDNSMDNLSKTFDGMLSNIADQWSKFQRKIMSFGVFDWMKSKLKFVLDELNRMEASGTLDKWAKLIADNIMTGLEAIWTFGSDAVALWRSFFPHLQATADALGGWRNLALAVAAIPLRGVFIGAAAGLFQIAGGAAAASRGLAGLGLGAAASGALRLGGVFAALLTPINWVRGALVALRIALISTGIGAAVVGLAMAGTWIYNNWSGLKEFFAGFGETFMASLGPARPLVEGIVSAATDLWDKVTELVGPIDASAEKWRAWGEAAGAAVGGVVEKLRQVVDFLKDNKITRSISSMRESVSGWFGGDKSEKLQKRASGGSFGPGPLLTGERGPELRYASRSGYIAHNRALQNMARLSQRARLAGAAAAFSASAGAVAAEPGAALNPDRYLTGAAAGGAVSISAPLTLNVSGHVDQAVMPDLRAELERFRERLKDELRDEIRRGNG